MKVVILAAGKSQRFLRRGVSTPKSLLPYNGRSVIEHNLLAFLDTGVHVVVVASPTISHHLRNLGLSNLTLVECPVVQPGPVVSALMASAHIEPNEQVMILDSDQVYTTSVIPSIVSRMSHETRLVVCDAGPSPNWCAVHHYDDGKVWLREKGNDSRVVVSGGYGFSSWELFCRTAFSLLSRIPVGTEPKLSHLVDGSYAELLRLERDEWVSLGTPEEFEMYASKESL